MGVCDIWTSGVQPNVINQNENVSISDARFPNKSAKVVNYIPNIFTYQYGAPFLQPQGIVEMVEATLSFGGNGNCTSIWWKGNANEVPEGVNLDAGTLNMTAWGSGGYNGANNTWHYFIDDSVSEDIGFFINPQGAPYGGSFSPNNGGIHCSLLVKAFAKKQNSFIWQRIA